MSVIKLYYKGGSEGHVSNIVHLISWGMQSSKKQPHCDGRKVKIIMLGDSVVGKTSVIRRFTDDTFEEILTATVGGAHMHVVSYV